MRNIFVLRFNLLFCLLAFCLSAYSQFFSEKCELDGRIFFKDCKRYTGDCSDGKANGWGELLLQSNNTLRGLFIDNKLQNFFIEYYSENNKSLLIGPNKVSALNGPCINISNNHVSLANYQNGSYLGNGNDVYQIPSPNFDFNGLFCDLDTYSVTYKDNCNIVPNSSLIIYISAREYNTRGDRKYWITMADLKTNKVVFSYGNFFKPISIENDIKSERPVFLGFSDDITKAYYETRGDVNDPNKYLECNLLNGLFSIVKKIPSKNKNQKLINDSIRNITYKDYGKPYDWMGLDKFKMLEDSSYIKMFNNSLFLESISNNSYKAGSGSSLVHFSKKNELINVLEFTEYNILDFDVDEKNERIAISYGGKDSSFLSYFDLKTFKHISNVFCRLGGKPGNIKFTKSGTYLLHGLSRGTALYLGNRLHYAVEGDVYGFNDDENIILSNSGSMLYVYDLEKKTIIYRHDIIDDFANSKFFNVDNKIYILSSHYKKEFRQGTRYLSKEKGNTLISFSMPKPLFSIPEFVKKPEDIIEKVLDYKNKSLENRATNQELNLAQISRNDSELFGNYVAYLFLSSFFESSNKYSRNKSHSGSISSPTSQSNRYSNQNCYSCSGTGKCRNCNKVFKNHYWEGKYKGWKSDSETRPGYVMCSTCRGSGVIYGSMDDNEPTSKPCYVSSCRNGWIYCTECNYNGNGSSLGSCKKCKDSRTSK